MKRCPECRRDYYDDTLLYCLDDGNALLDGPAIAAGRDEPATAILSGPPSVGPDLPQPTGRSEVNTTLLQPPATVDASDSSEKHPPANNPAKPIVAILAAVVLLLGGLLGYRYLNGGNSAEIKSIAVLPFENRSGNADTDYLSDGLTDSLIFRFSQLPDIKVSPTSSVMRYKGAVKDVSEIASELDVDGVLSGRLTQIGDNLSISVQLIDTRTNKIIWAEQYDRKMADLLATQRDIATTLTQKMQLKLAGDERGIAKKYTGSNEAYQLYLKGRYHWTKRTKPDLDKSVQAFKEAIGLDPNFALAYVGLAETYNSMAKNPDVAPREAVPFAKSAAGRALELDSTLAEAHSALGDSLAIYDWNWTESEREFKKALEFDPNIGYIHIAYSGSFLSAAGRQDEAIRAAERGVELEPLSSINNAILSSAYVLGRRYDAGLTQAQRTMDLDPNFTLGKFWLGMSLISNGKYEEALAMVKDIPESAMGGNALFVAGTAHARAGRRTEAEATILRIRELAKTRYIRTYCIAWIYAALGDKDKAFVELDKSFADRDCYLGRARVDPFMDPLRDDPRFKDLLKRMALPE